MAVPSNAVWALQCSCYIQTSDGTGTGWAPSHCLGWFSYVSRRQSSSWHQRSAHFQQEVKFLSHIVSEKGVATDPDKLQSVNTWPRPANAMEVRQFLGLCSYYRCFVANFAEIACPLHQITEQNRTFEWTDGADETFKHLKQALTGSPILVYPDTDASAFGIGAVLSQNARGGESNCIFQPPTQQTGASVLCNQERAAGYNEAFRSLSLWKRFCSVNRSCSIEMASKFQKPREADCTLAGTFAAVPLYHRT